MKRSIAIVIVLSGLVVPVFASDLERALESRWRGAWVLTGVEARSDCAGIHTNNRVNGSLVVSKGRNRFRPGELAQVTKIDLKRSRLDLLLSLPEPLLASHQEGPFTLYSELRCLVELDVELPRSEVKSDDVAAIDAALKNVLTRFATQDEAQNAKAWNHRVRESYPADYQQTLADYAAWRAQQANAAVQAKLDRAMDETGRLADRVTSDPDYLSGFAAGVGAMRSVDLSRCEDLMGRDFDSLQRQPPQVPASTNDRQQRYAQGFQDGQRLLFGLESLRGLPRCFVTVPASQRAAQGQ